MTPGHRLLGHRVDRVREHEKRLRFQVMQRLQRQELRKLMILVPTDRDGRHEVRISRRVGPGRDAVRGTGPANDPVIRYADEEDALRGRQLYRDRRAGSEVDPDDLARAIVDAALAGIGATRCRHLRGVGDGPESQQRNAGQQETARAHFATPSITAPGYSVTWISAGFSVHLCHCLSFGSGTLRRSFTVAA